MFTYYPDNSNKNKAIQREIKRMCSITCPTFPFVLALHKQIVQILLDNKFSLDPWLFSLKVKKKRSNSRVGYSSTLLLTPVIYMNRMCAEGILRKLFRKLSKYLYTVTDHWVWILNYCCRVETARNDIPYTWNQACVTVCLQMSLIKR